MALQVIGHARGCELRKREMQLDLQTGTVVGHSNLGAVQVGNSSNQAETKAVAGAVAASLEPIKPSQDVLAFLARNSGPAIVVRIPLSADMILLWHPSTYRRRTTFPGSREGPRVRILLPPPASPVP